MAFVVAGLVGSVFARFLITTSVDLVGVSRATPIRTTSPVFSAVVAIALFGERLSDLVAIGTLLVVAGLLVLTYDAYSDRETGGKSDRVALRHLLPEFAGSLLLGLTPSLRKFGLDAGTSVYGGLALNFITAFVVFGTYYVVRHRRDFLVGDGLPWFVGTCAFWALGFWCYFTALRGAPTVIVVPLYTTNPLFVIGFSWLFLDDVEEVTVGIVVGALAAVAGAALVVVG